MADSLAALRGALADHYTVLDELGSGGMATVYLAEDLRHHRQVAIKVLRPDLAATLGPERFLREIEIAARLQHPHILPLLDSGEADDFLFYVMPYVEGRSLRDKLTKEGELPVGEAVRILRDVVDALTEAHANGVVHRDIKPENILLRGRHALVTDFGVAKAVSEATALTQLTTAGMALGTPQYMAPEQASADPHLDHRVDIYAVGAVAYELLTGRPVFMGTTPQQILSAHVTEAPQPVTKHRDTVPPALESVVMRCLEKKPADRLQTAEELLPLLESLTTSSGGVTPTGTRPVPAAGGRRPWLLPAAVVVAAVLIVVGLLGSRLFTNSPITVTASNIRAVTSDPAAEWFPALSPDGSQIVYLAVHGNAGSVVIRSTRDIGAAFTLTAALPESWIYLFPEWSPDGEYVRVHACGAGECAWREVARLGGPARLVDLPPNSWTWSPDDSRVLVEKGDSVFTYAIVGGATTLLYVSERASALHHSRVWSPDGRRLAYVDENVRWQTSFNVSNSSIWMVEAEGGEPVRVTGEEFMDVSPAWLDNEHLLFVSTRDGPREVYLVEVGPEGARGEPQKVPGIVDPHSISYSAAGGNLAFTKATVRQNIRSYPLGSGPLSIADGRPVTSENAVIEEHDISPDGRWITYCSTLRGTMDVYARPLEGGSPIRITDLPDDEFAPQWSPDGTEIAFYGTDREGHSAVMLVAAGGGTAVAIASGPGYNNNPTWSPDGLEIAFHSNRTGQSEVWLTTRETAGASWGEATQVTEFGCFPYDWAPDGGGVLCGSSWRGGWRAELVLVSRDGEVVWRYSSLEAGVRGVGSSRFSRDGSTVYFYGIHEDGTEGVWAAPAHGGEPNLVVAFDDPDLQGMSMFSLGPDRLYVTVREVQMDIWVADLEMGR